MKYFSLFSGIGGFELGIQQAYEDNRGLLQGEATKDIREDSTDIKSGQTRPTCIGFSEIDKYAIQVYKKHFNHKEYGDITKLDPTTLPDFDLLCGGFPCQSFSIAGKRGGFGDTRGTLIFDVFRILKEKQPRLCLLENVKGLLSHDNGRTFKTIITSLAELGYAVEWQVLNAKNFGVPQNRERVFIIGHLGGFGGKQIFPIGEDGEVSSERQREISPAITSRYYKQGQSDPYLVRADKPSPLKEGNKPNRPNSIRRVSYTDGARIRRLTPTECERLMGLPDGWTEEGVEGKISDTQRYKLCGNGVVVNVVKEIISRLI